MASEVWRITQDEGLGPFEKYARLIDRKFKPKMLENGRIPKAHQTLIVVNVCAHPEDSQRERATRFVSCFNTQLTIKADIVSAADGKLAEGLVWFGNEPGGVDAQNLGIEHGYTQVVELDYIGNKRPKKKRKTLEEAVKAPEVEATIALPDKDKIVFDYLEEDDDLL